jgi:hypothetical protein
MSVELNQSGTEVHLNEAIDGVDDALIETIWHELERQVPYEQVCRVVTEIAREFQDAKVKTFVPMLVHRRTLERLRQEPIESTIR